jgi:Ca2+-binding RTX toxin-like protein
MATINYAVTLYEGQTYTVVFPAPPSDSYNAMVNRYTINLNIDPRAELFSDFVPSPGYGGFVTGTSETVVTKTDNVTEGNEYFQYVYDLTWQSGYYAESGGQTYVWTFTLKDARNATGNAAANTMNGTPGADKLNGGGGNDTLTGLAGNDVLTGGTGADKFVFKEMGTANADRITDFLHGTDKIALDDAVFTRLLATPAGGLKAVNFYSGSAAHDASDYIVYNPATGKLYYDPDGSGAQAARLIATLVGTPDSVSAGDFLVF